MKRQFLSAALIFGGLTACAPAQDTAKLSQKATVKPILYSVSASQPRGGTVTIQGRYLGGKENGRVRLGANDAGEGGYIIPDAAINSWTENMIVMTIPADAPLGGSWLFVEVGGQQSTGLPHSVVQ